MVANTEGTAAPLDAGRATETGHQAQWEAYERIARANGFWHHIEPWAAELTALRARVDASERVREAAGEVRRHITERTHPDCDGDSAQWDGGFKAACSQVLAILDGVAVATPVDMDALETAWGIIANAYEGDWYKATPEWRAAAERFATDWGKRCASHALRASLAPTPEGTK
jgi:hypothetical protein